MSLETFHDTQNEKLDEFAELGGRVEHSQRLGVNMIEVMPLAEFAGESF